MARSGGSLKAFNAFALEVRGFEKTLTRLVASSFIVSGVAAVAKAQLGDPALIATITLVGTVAGCGAILSTYLAWAHRPEDEYEQITMFDPAASATVVRINIALTLISLFAYTALPMESGAPILCVIFAVYFFFRALVTGALASRRIETQRALWNDVGEAGRRDWLEFRQRRIERDREIEERTREIAALSEDIDRSLRETNAYLWKAKIDRFKFGARQIWAKTGGRLYRWTVNVRVQLAGEGLLTVSERLARMSREQKIRELRARFDQEFFQAAYNKIVNQSLRAIADEHTGITFFRDGVWRFLRIHDAQTEASARELVAKLEDPEDQDAALNTVCLFFDENLSLSHQAEQVFEERGIKFFWPSAWQKAPAPQPE